MPVSVEIEVAGVDKSIRDVEKVVKAVKELNAIGGTGGSGGAGAGGGNGGSGKGKGNSGGESVIHPSNIPKEREKKIGAGGSNKGLALLAFSQGVEDYSMAGFKGVLNNIPQMLLFSGASAGMTAGISLLATALYVAGPALLEGWLKIGQLADATKNSDMFIANMKEMSKSLKDFKREQSYVAEENELAMFYQAIHENMQQPIEDQDKFKKNLDNTTSSILNQTNALRKYSDLTKIKKPGDQSQSVTEAQRTVADDVSDRNRLASRLAISNRTLATLRGAEPLAMTSASNRNAIMGEAFSEKAKIQSKIDVENTALDRIKKNQESFAGLIDRTASNVQAFMTPEEGKWVSTPGSGGMGGPNMKFIPFDNNAPKLKDGTLKDQTAGDIARNELIGLEKKKTASDDKITALERKFKLEDEANKKSLDFRIKNSDQIKGQNLLISDEEEALKKANEKIQNDKLVLRGQIIADGRSKLDAAQAMAESQRIDTGNLLSSKGRVGLAGNEAKNSLAVVNMQKQALGYLRQIAANTRQQLKATYS